MRGLVDAQLIEVAFASRPELTPVARLFWPFAGVDPLIEEIPQLKDLGDVEREMKANELPVQVVKALGTGREFLKPVGQAGQGTLDSHMVRRCSPSCAAHYTQLILL